MVRFSPGASAMRSKPFSSRTGREALPDRWWIYSWATSSPALRPVFETVDNTPILALANLNNSVVLGSLVAWLLLALPFFFLARRTVVAYRASYGERIRRSRAYNAMTMACTVISAAV